MSKIYEALLRAEQDRAAANEAQEDAVNGTADKATSFPARQNRPVPVENVFENSVVERQPSFSASAPGTSTSASGASASAAYAPSVPISSPASSEPLAAAPRLGTVRTDVWKPSFQQLPALQERGVAVEQFRSLRSRLFEFRDLNTLKSVLISSGLPQEGKSYVAANLAISFARHKTSRVLLIDGDMRRSSLHHLLGCRNEPGLTTYLAGKATLGDIMQRARVDERSGVLPHGLATLTFIAGGNEGDKAADLAGNRRFEQLIADASPHFDWIVVDSSPVNLVTDGVNLAHACDGVLLVVRGGVTKLESAQRAMSELKASKLLGVVLNAVDKSDSPANYYGYDTYDSYDSQEIHKD